MTEQYHHPELIKRLLFLNTCLESESQCHLSLARETWTRWLSPLNLTFDLGEGDGCWETAQLRLCPWSLHPRLPVKVPAASS